MAKVHFKQAVAFGGKDYGVGTHSVPEEVLGHWYFKHMVNHGLAADASGSSEASPLTSADRNEKLIAAVKAKMEAQKEAAKKSFLAALEANSHDEGQEEDVPVKAEKSKKGK